MEKVVLLHSGKSCTTSSSWIPQGGNTARASGCSGAIQGAYPSFFLRHSFPYLPPLPPRRLIGLARHSLRPPSPARSAGSFVFLMLFLVHSAPFSPPAPPLTPAATSFSSGTPPTRLRLFHFYRIFSRSALRQENRKSQSHRYLSPCTIKNLPSDLFFFDTYNKSLVLLHFQIRHK